MACGGGEMRTLSMKTTLYRSSRLEPPYVGCYRNCALFNFVIFARPRSPFGRPWRCLRSQPSLCVPRKMKTIQPPTGWMTRLRTVAVGLADPREGCNKAQITPHWFQENTRFWYRNDLRGRREGIYRRRCRTRDAADGVRSPKTSGEPFEGSGKKISSQTKLPFFRN